MPADPKPLDRKMVIGLSGEELDRRVLSNARLVLENAWNEDGSAPHKKKYKHLWMWDGFFHGIGWLGLNDPRCLKEVEAVFVGQLANGFVPHMRYRGRTYRRGVLPNVSSYTQPPVYMYALQLMDQRGMHPSRKLVDQARRGLEALWRDRLHNGLLRIVHPWESGADDSPRWDSWFDLGPFRKWRWRYLISRLMHQHLTKFTEYGECGQAISNRRFMVAPVAFNAIAAHAATTL